MRRRKKNKYLNYNKNDPVVHQIIEYIRDGTDPKQISNKMGLDLGYIIEVKKKHCRKVNSMQMSSEPLQESLKNVIDNLEMEEKEDMVIEKKKREEVTKDDIENWAILWMEGETIHNIGLKYNRSDSVINRGLRKYQEIDPSFIFTTKGKKKVEAKKPVEKKEEEVAYKEEEIKEETTKDYGVAMGYIKVCAKTRRLTDKGIEYIIARLKDGEYPVDIANKLKLNPNNIYRIRKNKKFMNSFTTIHKEPKEEKKEEEVAYNENIKEKFNLEFKEIETSKTKVVGLIYGRHEEIPADEFIFKEVSSNLMFDYDKQEKLCKEYIDQIKSEGYTALEVYATGLPCINNSLAKVALENQFPLTNKHYDKKSNTYKDQVIVPNTSTKSEYSYLLDKYNKVYGANDIIEDSGERYHFLVSINGNTDNLAYLFYSMPTVKGFLTSMLDNLIEGSEISISKL